MTMLQPRRTGPSSVWLRPIIILAATMLGNAIVASRAIEALLQRPLIETTGISASPFIALAILLGFFAWPLEKESNAGQINWPGFGQIIIGCIGWIVAIGIAVLLTHPSATTLLVMEEYGRQPGIGAPLIASMLSIAILLPALPALVILFPISTLRKAWIRIAAGTVILLIYAIGPILEAGYFRLTALPLLSLVRGLLAIFPGTPIGDLKEWEIGFGTFRVTLGYACTDFSALMLFVGLFVLAWWSMHRRNAVRHLRAAAALLIGVVSLWILNVLRIAAIVLIGSRYPDVAVSLFHSAVGIVLFLGFFVVYVKLVLPMVKVVPARRIVR